MPTDPDSHGHTKLAGWIGVGIAALVFLDKALEVKPKVAEVLHPTAATRAADSLGRITRERGLQALAWLDSVRSSRWDTPTHQYRVKVRNGCPDATADVAFRYFLAPSGPWVTVGWYSVRPDTTHSVLWQVAGSYIAYHVNFTGTREWRIPDGQRDTWSVVSERFADNNRFIFEGTGVSKRVFVRVPLRPFASLQDSTVMLNANCVGAPPTYLRSPFRRLDGGFKYLPPSWTDTAKRPSTRLDSILKYMPSLDTNR